MAEFGWIPLGLCAGLVTVGSHVLLYRTILKGNLLRALSLGYLAGAMVIVAGANLMGPQAVADWRALDRMLALLLAHACGTFTFFHLNTMVRSARRVRLVLDLHVRPDGQTLAEIGERYNARQQVGRRIDRLLRHGQVIRKDGNLILLKKDFLLVARVIRLFKLLVFGKAETGPNPYRRLF